MDKANTPDEIVDVVNEMDEVVGQSTKGEVNSNPKLIHREIGILIFDSNENVLIQQRSRNKKVWPLVWMLSVGGHVPSGMTVLESAHKELQEELGFDTKLVQYEKLFLHYPNETHFAVGYLGKISPETIITQDINEIEQFKLVSKEELEEMEERGARIEEYSLRDFRKFFAGDYNDLIKDL